MKILTMLGTRPEIIRLSRIIARLDQLTDHVLVHTGQNYDDQLSKVFFDELHVRPPDHYLGVRGDTAGAQIAEIIRASETLLKAEQPDRLLILGDTNSALSAFVAKRLGIPVYHLEAGNRCFDDRVPEEVNRRVVDHCSDVLMPYTNRSRDNLLREGIPPQRIFVVGNPINEVLQHTRAEIDASTILDRQGLTPGRYFLATMHRQENVDVRERLESLLTAFELLTGKYGMPVICSLHPRTAARIREFRLPPPEAGVRLLAPLGLPDFLRLERDAWCVLSDSGTVQEECAILGVANVTIRDTTERPETIECGSGMLSGVQSDAILRAVATVTSGNVGSWQPPPEYMVEHVSSTVAKIVLGHRTEHQSTTGA